MMGGTREPVYDEDSYPSTLDWRSMGVVMDVHSQGSCGEFWECYLILCFLESVSHGFWFLCCWYDKHWYGICACSAITAVSTLF